MEHELQKYNGRLMDEIREMYESYWEFEADKWIKIDPVSRQVISEILMTRSAKKLDLTELLQKCLKRKQ